MSLLIGALFRQQPQPPGNPEDVDVDWEDRAIENKEQCAGDGFRPYTFEAFQKLNRFIESNRTQERQVE
jgi:hypothetical protein